MAKETKEREGSSTVVIAVSALLALGAAGGVYYCWDQAAKAEDLLARSKSDYKKMAEQKRPVEEYLRQQKGRTGPAAENTEDMMVFLDKKSREAQIPPGSITFAKNAPSQLTAWTETSFTATLQSGKDAPIKKSPIVDFLRKVETERRSTKIKTVQLVFNGDEFKSATFTISQFTAK